MLRSYLVETLQWYVIFLVPIRLWNEWGDAVGLVRMLAGMLILVCVWDERSRKYPGIVRAGGELAGGCLTGGVLLGLLPALLRVVLE